jgi:hypothetical protein
MSESGRSQGPEELPDVVPQRASELFFESLDNRILWQATRCGVIPSSRERSGRLSRGASQLAAQGSPSFREQLLRDYIALYRQWL